MNARTHFPVLAQCGLAVMTTIFSFTSFNTNNMENASTQEWLDKSAIQELLVRYAYAVDFRDWQSYDQVFTKDALIDYTAFDGPRGSVETAREFLKKALAPFASSQHSMSTVLIDLKGDTAFVRSICYCPMVLKLDNQKTHVFICGLWYRDIIVRTAEGWKIKERVEEKSYIHNMPEGFKF